MEASEILDAMQQSTISTRSDLIENSELIKHQYSEQLKEDRKEIISVLESSDIESIPEKIRRWLEKQSEERRQQFEKYQQIHEEKQAHHLATDQAQIIELACVLNKLAINSQNADEFCEKLKNEEKRLTEKHQELKSLRKTVTVPVIIRQAIRRGSVVVDVFVNPPYGQQVFQQLIAGGISDIGGFDTISITLGELDLGVKQERMNERYNRYYEDCFGGTYWTKPLKRGGKPYFCPQGWRRFGIKVADTKEEFDRRWGHWCMAYHGTAHTNAARILATGLRVGRGCHSKNKMVVYLSPSITYCAHYRYSKPWKNSQKPGKYYQMIFQCRVNPEVLTPDKIKSQTLKCPKYIRIDEHFANDEIEWIIDSADNENFITDNIICYGIMIRVCDRDPYELPESEWWQYTPYPRDYQ
ncbi:unnamed protein product [Rotaria sp. Silwood1]|nr:unnamed protein product [Rotaria sp. Silwood1]